MESTSDKASPEPCFFPGGLVPIRVDVEAEDRRFRDCFLFNTQNADSALLEIVREAVTESGCPESLAIPASQQAQSQLAELRDLQAQVREVVREAQEASGGVTLFRPCPQDWEEESLQLIRLDVRVNQTVLNDCFYWDVNNPSSDPDSFARELCEDLEITDPEFAPAVSIALREQLVEVARHAVGWREGRNKKGRRGERATAAAAESLSLGRSFRGVSLLTLLQAAGGAEGTLNVFRPRQFWGVFSPVMEKVVEVPLEDHETTADAPELRRVRFKRRHD